MFRRAGHPGDRTPVIVDTTPVRFSACHGIAWVKTAVWKTPKNKTIGSRKPVFSQNIDEVIFGRSINRFPYSCFLCPDFLENVKDLVLLKHEIPRKHVIDRIHEVFRFLAPGTGTA